MKREFKAGEVIFHYDYFNADLHGFGKVLKEAVVDYDDDRMIVEVNNSGENETIADRVYKITEHLQCCRCGCVVVDEHQISANYPYYCPDCQENKYRIEVTQVDDEDWEDFFDMAEEDWIGYNVKFHPNYIVHESYSGIYTYEIVSQSEKVYLHDRDWEVIDSFEPKIGRDWEVCFIEGVGTMWMNNIDGYIVLVEDSRRILKSDI